MIDKLNNNTYAGDMESGDQGGIFPAIFGLVFAVLYIVALWKVYVKTGKPGWAAIIPFYNLYVLLKIAGKPGWWLILYFIPIANVIVHLMVSVAVAKVFNRSTAFGVVMLWLLSAVGYLILGFGKSTYTEPAFSTSAATTPTPANPT